VSKGTQSNDSKHHAKGENNHDRRPTKNTAGTQQDEGRVQAEAAEHEPTDDVIQEIALASETAVADQFAPTKDRYQIEDCDRSYPEKFTRK
jgi:hypothetical protein